VALKILKDDYAQDADFKRRFHAESQAVAMLSHPNIVAVYDVSRSGNIEYIVMELIDGITLKQYMQKKGRLSWREVLHFSTQITKALIHAHSRGIIHRDIKPHNIMILRDGSVKVADFGIARFSNKQNTLTQEALGSVHYISPEQARGSHIDARSDIYSVGVVMYEMLTMRLPYEGDSPVSVAIQHINSIPLTPREIDESIPEALETITMKAMSANLSKRYPSAEALLQDLEEFRKNPSISFDYNIAELMAKDEDEPTKKLPGVPGNKQNVRRSRPEEMRGEDDEAYRARQRNKSLTMITGLASVLIFVLAMFYLVITLLGGMEGNDGLPGGQVDDTVEVPNLVNEIATEVINDRRFIADFIIEVAPDAEHSSVIDEGRIIRQDPAAGTRVRKGRVITITVSRGAREFSLISLNDFEYRQAQGILTSREYNLRFEVEHETSDIVTRDFVIRTEPPAGTLVREGDLIKLVVSKGVEAVFVEMPSLVGQIYDDDLDRELDRLELIPSITELESERPKGEIVWQSVPAGTQVETRTEIQIHISLGSPETNGDNGYPNGDDNTTPTPDPNEPTPTPTPTPVPGGQEVTVPITVTLPSTPGTTRVEIRRNGILIISEDVNNSLGQTVYTITGMPTDSIDILFDGNIQYTQPLQQ
jgi:serine/threonine-protein kinase